VTRLANTWTFPDGIYHKMLPKRNNTELAFSDQSSYCSLSRIITFVTINSVTRSADMGVMHIYQLSRFINYRYKLVQWF